MIPEHEGLISGCVFVALGSFNPAILHPDWFSRHSILPDEETERLLAEPTKKEIPEIGVTLSYGQKFLVDPTRTIIHFLSFTLKVERTKFELICHKKEKFPLMLDFIKKFFLILNETPVSAYGINFDEHINFDECATEVIDKFFSKKEKIDSIFQTRTTYGHTIFATVDETKVRFIIEPSNEVEDGVYLRFNFHHDNESLDSESIVTTIEDSFQGAIEFGEKLISYCGTIHERLPKEIRK